MAEGNKNGEYKTHSAGRRLPGLEGGSPAGGYGWKRNWAKELRSFSRSPKQERKCLMPSEEPILLVEDDDLDAMITRRSIGEIGVTNPLIHKKNGEEALKYLATCSAPMPRVLLLDLNMPKMNGIEFLEVLRTDEAFRDIRVVIVTTSPEAQDIARSFELGAASYVVKCSDYEEFRKKMAVIKSYLMDVLPAAASESVR
jgi:CheY-like chemotaxis protein